MGSRFSMEQMMTTLSARSRITSSSNSFQPIKLCSISTCSPARARSAGALHSQRPVQSSLSNFLPASQAVPSQPLRPSTCLPGLSSRTGSGRSCRLQRITRTRAQPNAHACRESGPASISASARSLHSAGPCASGGPADRTRIGVWDSGSRLCSRCWPAGKPGCTAGPAERLLPAGHLLVYQQSHDAAQVHLWPQLLAVGGCPASAHFSAQSTQQACATGSCCCCQLRRLGALRRTRQRLPAW